MDKEDIEEAIEVLEDASADMLTETGDENYYAEAIAILRQALDTDLARVGEVGVWGAVQCKPQEEVEDGWCDWVCPKPVGYLMQCCDCELIHEVDFRVVRYESEDSEVYEVVDNPNLQAQMRLRRRDDISPKKPHQEKQEPVAWLKTWSDGSVSVLKTKSHAFADHELEPLYTAPPKTEWVGLTAYEIQEIHSGNQHWGDFACAIEAKLREKNNG